VRRGAKYGWGKFKVFSVRFTYTDYQERARIKYRYMFTYWYTSWFYGWWVSYYSNYYRNYHSGYYWT
jgi:hypothetical protein